MRRALGLVASTRVAVFSIDFAVVVLVSRLLTPAEIGIFSVSVALITLGHVFRDFGVGQYLIQLKEVTRESRRAAFTVTLSFSWCIAALLVLGRDAAAAFYQSTGMADVMLLLAVNFLILPFGAPLRTLLQRDLQFGKLAVVNLANHLAQGGVTLATAWAGASYMSMAWGSIAGNLANVVVLLIISPRGALDWPTRHGLREVLAFGSKSSVTSLATTAGSASPDLILGRTLGFADVAFYSRAKGLVGMALDQLMYVVRSVYAPTFAKGFREGRDPVALYTQTMGLLLGLTVPTVALLALLSPYLIVGLFGSQWERSAPLGSMFCVFALLTAPYTLASTSLVAAGHVGQVMRTRLAIEAARVLVMLSSLFWRLEWVVALLGLVYLLESLLMGSALRSAVGVSVRGLWKSVWRSYALIPVTLLAPGLLLAVSAMYFPLHDLSLVALASGLGVAGWAVGIVVLDHPLKAELADVRRAGVAWLRALVKRGRS
jgi:O-antigen/teichoic acid export membrane protein